MISPLVAAAAAVFVFVALVTGTAMNSWLVWKTPERRRLRAFGAQKTGILPLRQQGLTQTVDPMLARLSKLLPKNPKEMSRLRRRMTQAGYPQPSAAVIYAVSEVALPVLVALLVVVIAGLRAGLAIAVLLAVGAYVAPSFYIAHRIKIRRKLIRNGLPDALDLLTLCTEAGSGLDQALVKATDELATAHPELTHEMRLITTEIRAGKPRVEAFKNFAARTGVDDVESLVSMLVQTDRFGTSISDALRIQADTSRTKRRQEAEERAAKIGVKLVFPLVFFLFPALYIVCFGPVVVRVYRVFIENAG